MTQRTQRSPLTAPLSEVDPEIAAVLASVLGLGHL